MKSFFRTPLFWTLFAISALCAGAGALYLFPRAYPIIHLNITMDRTQAIRATQRLAQELELGPEDPSYAASFATDEQVKTFVELEAGGKEAFVQLMENNLYEPYTWLVRQFKPFDQHQLFVRFTPEGAPYAFEEIISEDTTGTNLSEQAARQKAQNFASGAPWNISLSDFRLVEDSQETMPSGRIDHTFTYERTNEAIGQGFFRLKLVVSGDRVTKLAHEIKVPDAFSRRYAQMRSANANIAYIANLFMLLLYILGCCLIGLIVLLRDHWIVWRTPIYWALFVAFLIAINIPNKLPLAWMHYNTSLSPFGFMFQQGIGMLYSFIFLSIALSMIFMAAESLSRKAFGHHPQLWHVFNKDNARTVTILGYTITGYLLVPIILCYTMLFTVITMNRAGWWIPSSSLFNPNILATYFPWLESISLSLQAGFMEECLFRAIPLASAALLGNRFGKRNWWIAGAFVLQAFVFGAAHANYPAQPAYARLVELLADSALFGGIFLWLGLLPAIISHFIYDVFWFALPIFVSSTSNALINKVIIIALSLIPLFIVIGARLRAGAWSITPASFYNAAWQPEEPVIAEQEKQTTQTKTIAQSILFGSIVCGILGLSTWSTLSRFNDNAPHFKTTRIQAQKNALEVMQKKNIDIQEWYPITAPLTSFAQNPGMNKQHRFVWQTGNPQIYEQLINSYLMPPHWITRLVKFDGDIVERAEEYQIFINPDGSLFRFVHNFPETKSGASLSKEAALALAKEAIITQFSIEPEKLQPLSAVATKQPDRLDWNITYITNQEEHLGTGQARIIAALAGDELVDLYRAVHVPESWERNEENHLMFAAIITQVCQLLVYLLAVIGAIVALMQWQVGTPLSFGGMFLFLAFIFLFELANSWPTVLYAFNTSQPFYDQLFRSFSIAAIMLIMRAGALAIMFGFVTYTHTRYRISSWTQSLIAGISFGTLLAGVQAVVEWMIPATKPTWANFTPLRFSHPLIAGIDSMILHYMSLTIFLLLCLLAINWVTNYGTKRIAAGVALLCAAGFIGSGLLYADNLIRFSIAGLSFTALFATGYYLLLRFDRSIIPIITSSYLILEIAQEMAFHGYPQAVLVSLGSIATISLIGAIWSYRLQEQ